MRDGNIVKQAVNQSLAENAFILISREISFSRWSFSRNYSRCLCGHLEGVEKVLPCKALHLGEGITEASVSTFPSR